MLPHTLRLALAAMVITVVAGVGLGVLAAVFHDTWVDRLAMLAVAGRALHPDLLVGAPPDPAVRGDPPLAPDHRRRRSGSG